MKSRDDLMRAPTRMTWTIRQS